jgi:hypothetical protein
MRIAPTSPGEKTVSPLLIKMKLLPHTSASTIKINQASALLFFMRQNDAKVGESFNGSLMPIQKHPQKPPRSR